MPRQCDRWIQSIGHEWRYVITSSRYSARLTSGKGYFALSSSCDAAGDQIWSACEKTRSWPRTSCSTSFIRSEIVNKVTHRVYMYKWRAAIHFRDKRNPADIRMMHLPASCRFDQKTSKQSQTKASCSVSREVATDSGHPKHSRRPALPQGQLTLCLLSHVNLVVERLLLTTRVTSAGQLLVACIGAL